MIRLILMAALLMTALASHAASRTVMASEFGREWPLTVTDGTISCTQQGAAKIATFIAPGGKWYALNGAASSRGHADIDPIWKDNPENPGAKKSIRPLIDAALKLCR